MLYDLMCAHKGRGIRDPEYIRQYWEEQRAAQAPTQPPVVGPILDAEPVEEMPPRPAPIDLKPETAPTTVQVPPPVKIPASVSEPQGEQGDDDDPERTT